MSADADPNLAMGLAGARLKYMKQAGVKLLCLHSFLKFRHSLCRLLRPAEPMPCRLVSEVCVNHLVLCTLKRMTEGLEMIDANVRSLIAAAGNRAAAQGAGGGS